MRIASKSDVGHVRRTNQDCYSAAELSGGVIWAVVCDGMGGANGGNIASECAVKVFSEQISSAFRPGMGSNSVRTMLQSAVYAANSQIYDMSRAVDSLGGMGTTIVAAVVMNGTAHLMHAGDSRAYLIEKTGCSYELKQITRDHSVVSEMVQTGQLTEQEASTDPRRNVITRALGVDEMVEIDYNEVSLPKDSFILMCTDGLTNHVTAEEILNIIKTETFYEYPQKLVDLANENGGGDNITVLLIAE